MNRQNLIRVCDALVLALIVGVVGRYSVTAGAVVAAIGLWLALRRASRSSDRARRADAGLARCRETERQMMANAADPLSPAHWDD